MDLLIKLIKIQLNYQNLLLIQTYFLALFLISLSLSSTFILSVDSSHRSCRILKMLLLTLDLFSLKSMEYIHGLRCDLSSTHGMNFLKYTHVL